MPRHVWTVLCNSSAIDIESNSVSLHEIIEQLVVAGDAPRDQTIGIPSPIDLVTLWSRTNLDVPEEGCRGRFRYMAPDGRQLIAGEYEILTGGQFRRSRNRSHIPTVVVHGPGLYEYIVEYITPATEEWIEAARIPL